MTVTDRAGTDSGWAARIVDGPGGYSGVVGDEEWAAQVRHLATLRGATLLAHNYQLPAIQDVADHVGDSLALSRMASSVRPILRPMMRVGVFPLASCLNWASCGEVQALPWFSGLFGMSYS